MHAVEISRAGRTAEGFELLKEVITENEKVDVAYYNLAALYKEAGRIGEALEVLTLGLEKNPASYEIFYYYVNFLIDAGRSEEAISLLERMNFPQMELDPEIWNTLGIAYGSQKDYAKAIQAFELAISLDSEYRFSFSNLGHAYLSLFLATEDPANYQKALENLKKAIELAPEFAPAYYDLGMAYIQSGNLDGAIYCWEKVYELKAEIPQVLLFLGRAYSDKGDNKKALYYLNLYKTKYYQVLPSDKRQELDSLIQELKKNSTRN